MTVLASGKTLIVSTEINNYESVQAAVDDLKLSGVLSIMPGDYNESTTITKKLKINPASEGEVIISSDSVAFSLVGDADLYLSGLKLKNSPGDGIALGKSAVGNTENGWITENDDKGKELKNGSKIEITGSEILKNGEEGLYFSDSTEATLIKNLIADNGESGVFFMEEARLILEDNEITGSLIGLELKYPNRFKGSVTGSGNEITGTESSFEGISETLQKELLKN